MEQYSSEELRTMKTKHRIAFRQMYNSDTGRQILAQRLYVFVFKRLPVMNQQETERRLAERNFVLLELEKMGIVPCEPVSEKDEEIASKRMMRIVDALLDLPILEDGE